MPRGFFPPLFATRVHHKDYDVVALKHTRSPAPGLKDEMLSMFIRTTLPPGLCPAKNLHMFNPTEYSIPQVASREKSSCVSRSWAPVALLLGIAFLPGCAKKTACLMEKDTTTTALSCSPDKLFARPERECNSLTVTAMAYTAQSVGKSHKSMPRAANGQRLTPDVNAIAVSPDLMEVHGLRLDQTVRIHGLEGEYKVMDLMSSRHSQTIDIYFGNDQAAARQWGKRTLTISWE